MDPPQSRAATLMNAARRNHFAATIEKYEAKAKQAKASTKDRRRALAPPPSEQTSKEHQKICVTESVVPAPKMAILDHSGSASEQNTQVNYSSDTQFERDFPQGFLEHKLRETDFLLHRVDAQQHVRENAAISRQRRVHPDQKEIISGVLHRSSSSSSIIMNGMDDLDMANYRLENVFPIDMENSNVPMMGACHHHVEILPQLEVDIAEVAAALNVRIKAADMSTHMQEHAFRCARESLNIYGKQQSRCIASTLKTEFDKAYGPAWHCIVGTSFGSYVTHSLGGFVYFYLDKVSILLFKTTVEPI